MSAPDDKLPEFRLDEMPTPEYAQEITFEGCRYTIISPEDYAAMYARIATLEARALEQDAALAAERALRESAEKDAARLRDVGSRYLGVLDSYNTAPHEAQRAEDEFRAAIDSALQSDERAG